MTTGDTQRRDDRAARAFRRERAHFNDMAALAGTTTERDLWLAMAGQIDDYLDQGERSAGVPLLDLEMRPP